MQKGVNVERGLNPPFIFDPPLLGIPPWKSKSWIPFLSPFSGKPISPLKKGVFELWLLNGYFHRNQNMRKLSFLLSFAPTFSPKLFNNFWTRGNWNVRLKTLVNAERLVNGSVDARSHYEDRRQTLENNFHGSWMPNIITPRRHTYSSFSVNTMKKCVFSAFPHLKVTQGIINSYDMDKTTIPMGTKHYTNVNITLVFGLCINNPIWVKF